MPLTPPGSRAPYSNHAAQEPATRTSRRTRLAERRSKTIRRAPPTISSAADPESRLNEQEADDNFTVRYFERTDQNTTELERESDFNTSLDSFGPGDVKPSLDYLEATLQSPKEKAAFGDMIKQMGGLWSGVKNQGDIDNVSAQIEARSKQIDKEIEDATEGLPEDVVDAVRATLRKIQLDTDGVSGDAVAGQVSEIPTKPWTLNQRRKISKLNAAINHAQSEKRRTSVFSQASISAVYRAYHAARLALARGWVNVPIDVWDFLWSVFATDESVNPHRLSHISLLARDMSDANITLSPAQQILTIEAVFVEGWESRAIENWRRNIPTLGEDKAETFQEFWELGVRMHCRMGNLDQAQRAADKLIARRLDARILMPIIRSWCEKTLDDAPARGWEKYRQMRGLLGKSMKLKDYDQVIAYFLTNGQVENALYAFVDMMSDGQIDLAKQKYMPSVIANKFFLGKWLKRLIGAGDLDGAHNVVEFMMAKGVQASPIQLNGLIGAWQRSGSAANMERAEALGWSMIESRVAFVAARKAKTLQYNKPGRNEPAEYPRATLETFCIMADNFRKRDLHSRQEQLFELFGASEISPDAFIMNQLLESYIQAGKSSEALDLYNTLVVDQGVKPDPHTFTALWKSLPVNRLHIIAPEEVEEHIIDTRKLFAHMVASREVFGSEAMHEQLARKILHSFRRLQDSPGLTIALATLKEVFKFYPSDILTLELAIGTHKLSSDTLALRKALMIAKRDMDFSLLKWAGDEPEKLNGPERGEALHAYLLKLYATEIGNEKEARRMMLGVAKDMGVLELLPAKKGGIV